LREEILDELRVVECPAPIRVVHVEHLCHHARIRRVDVEAQQRGSELLQVVERYKLNLKKQILETSFSLQRLQRVETRRIGLKPRGFKL
jgi:hypothetical protein